MLRLRPRARGAARARAAADQARAAPGPAGRRSCGRCAHRVWERPYLGAGLLLYDTHRRAPLGAACPSPVARRGARGRRPALRPDALIGAVQFYDAAEDDARMVAILARTAAAAHGATVATRGRWSRGCGAAADRVIGVEARDELDGASFDPGTRTSRSRPAPGPTAARARAAAASTMQMRPSKGIHIVVAARPDPDVDRAARRGPRRASCS